MVRQTKQSREDVLERSPAGTAGRSDVERKRQRSFVKEAPKSLRTERGEGSSYETEEPIPGSIHVRPVYWYAVDVGIDSNGNRKRVKGRSLKSPMDAYRRCMKNVERRSFEGNDKPIRKKRRRQRETSRELSDLTVAEYYARWISDIDAKVLRGSLAPNTAYHYKGDFKRHVLPALGHLQMWQVEKDDVRDFFQKTLAAKRKMKKVEGERVKTDEPLLGPSGLRGVYRPLKKMFQYAVDEDEILPDNPVRANFVPKSSEVKEPADKKTVIAKTSIARLLMEKAERHEDEFMKLFIGLHFIGLRKGERDGLCWSSITNLSSSNGAIMRIERQYINEPNIYGEGNRHVLKDQVKTKHSEREFPIPETLRKKLVAWKQVQDKLREQASWKPLPGLDDFVLTTAKGKPITGNVDDRLWHGYREKWLDEKNPAHKPHIGVNDWRAHLNRHITATVLHTQEVDIETAMRILGHGEKDMARFYIAMTANTLRPSINTYDDFWTTPAAQINSRIKKAGDAIYASDEEDASEETQKKIIEVEKRVASEPVSYSTKQVNNDKNSADVTSVEAVETEPKARVELIRKKKQDKKFGGMKNMTLNGKSRND